MTNQMRAFLIDYAALLQKYQVDVTARADYEDYDGYVSSIDFEMTTIYDNEGVPVRSWDTAETPSIHDADIINIFLTDNPVS